MQESFTRVRYKDTDQMAIAHHSNYIVWFEIGRTDLCREAGISYREIERRGFLLVVTAVHCNYRIPYRYDDVVRIETRLALNRSRRVRFDYRMTSEDGSVLHGEGHSEHVWVDAESRRPSVAPADIVATLQGAFG